MTKRWKNGYTKDESGLFHFRVRIGGTNVNDAAELAIQDHPGSPAWFWWNHLPVPIFMEDTPRKLVNRWKKLRVAEDEERFLTELERVLELDP